VPTLVTDVTQPNTLKSIVRASTTQRIPALDFTKGALVVLMVIYHWLNYFVGAHGYLYRYLRFITPSFIFITGFLISNAYLSKHSVTDSRLPKRLAQRGLKILGIFVVLNVALNLLLDPGRIAEVFRGCLSAKNLAAYVTGNIFVEHTKVASFYILVPIGCLLLLSALLVLFCRFNKYVFHVVGALFLLCILLLDLNDLASPNLELVTMGLLGVIIGYVPIERLITFIGQPFRLGVAYASYIVAITVWNVIYPLQIVGVCLSLMLIYLLGTRSDDLGGVGRQIVRLGKYSLFGYIVQIAMLQLLHRTLQSVDQGIGVVVLSLFAAMALTIGTVDLVDRMRVRSSTMNSLYAAIFS
jgi:peptidoglycan/LPS O-acetylase OafA/YrhL